MRPFSETISRPGLGLDNSRGPPTQTSQGLQFFSSTCSTYAVIEPYSIWLDKNSGSYFVALYRMLWFPSNHHLPRPIQPASAKPFTPPTLTLP